MGRFPEFLIAEGALASWDVFSIGYSTSLAFDLAGVWSADPEIITLGGLIETVADLPPIDAYESIAILAHSMGGLLVQRALLSNSALRERVSHVLLFGTPSNGLEKASPFNFWKRQVRDMALGSPFITKLRSDWTTTIGLTFPFAFVTVAGDRDEFVPRTSSIEPFPESRRRVAYGKHLEIVTVKQVGRLSPFGRFRAETRLERATLRRFWLLQNSRLKANSDAAGHGI